MISKKRILVAPLNWGLGHASRCIPIINELLNHDFEVIITAKGRSFHLLKQEFPKLEFIKLEGQNIKYPNKIPLSVSIFFQIPKILYSIYREHKNLKKTIKKCNIDGVISDNRYGLFNKEIPTIFITHQLQIQSPFLKNILLIINHFFINKFNQCWIVDNKRIRLAGELSIPDTSLKNYRFIGTLSRFKYYKTKKIFDLCFILSGPEPQRTFFEKKIKKELKNYKGKYLLILGKTESKKLEFSENIKTLNYATSKDLNNYILQSELIISRSGYSTIMDLYKLSAKAVFIATPGQTEQEYLSKKLKSEQICYSEKQKDFNLKRSISESENYSGFKYLANSNTNWEEIFKIFSE